MARIRTIKPEFPQSETTGALSRDARLLFIQLWTIVDDAGRTRAASRMLASLLYPYDDDARDLIGGWLTELDKQGCIIRYEVAGSQYLQVANWLDHQKIDRPSTSRLPEPPQTLATTREPSRAFDADLGPRTSTLERNSEAKASGADAPLDPTEPEREFFKRGKELLGKSSGGQLAKLRSSCGNNIGLARSKLELASTKENPAEFVAAVIRGPPSRQETPYQRKQRESLEVLEALGDYATGSSSSDKADFGALPGNPGDRSERVRGGDGAVVELLPATGSRSRL